MARCVNFLYNNFIFGTLFLYFGNVKLLMVIKFVCLSIGVI